MPTKNLKPAARRKKEATKFEEKIKQFLTNLEFNDVEGAKDTFRIGYPNEHQIDVIAGWEGTVFIFECKTSREFNKTKNLKNDLYSFKGKIPEIHEGLKKHPVYKKYRNYRYILVVNEKVALRTADKIYANSNPPVYLWNEDFLLYYNNLYEYLKPYAKYDLLGEMGVKPADQEPIRIPAFRTKFGKVNAYTFLINPTDLLEVAYVARRERAKERYYQRIIDRKRLTKIQKYIDCDGKFPNNIIIAFKEGLKINFRHKLNSQHSSLTGEWRWLGVEFGVLEFPKDYRSCWIIDGQHRLYSFIHAQKWFNMSVTAFENLDIENQCRFFLDINKNQKPVDADLVWDLNGDMIPSEKDGIISNIVKSLNTDGVLFHKIYIPSSGIHKKKGLIKLSALCIAIKKRRIAEQSTNGKNLNPLYDDDIDKRKKKVSRGLVNFLDCLSSWLKFNWSLGQDGFVLSNGGIAVMVGLYQKILERIIEKDGRIPKKEDVEFYVRPLRTIFDKDYKDKSELKKLRMRCTSEGGKNELLQELILKIRDVTGDNRFGGQIEAFHSKQFRELEGKLKEIVNEVMSRNFNDKWIETQIPIDMYKRCLRFLEKHNLKSKSKPYTQLGLGELTHIIKQHENLFYPIFVNEEIGFGTKAEFEGALALVKRIRNTQASHDVSVAKRTYDDMKLSMHFDIIQSCIDNWSK